jgi:hypothetical protein
MDTQLKGQVLPFKGRNGSGSSGAPAIVLPAVVAKPPAAKRSKGTKKPRLSDEVRFWSKVAKAGPHDCWQWKEPVNTGNSYPQFHVTRNGKRKMYTAHRFAYELAFGPVPGSMNVLHTCGCKTCENPSHFYVGSQLQNAADAKRHGAKYRKRLTPTEVEKIRKLHGILNARQVGATFDVSCQAIKNIWSGRTHRKSFTGATARGERFNQIDAGASA